MLLLCSGCFWVGLFIFSGPTEGLNRGHEWGGNFQSHWVALSPHPCVSAGCPKGAWSLEVTGVEAGQWPPCRENGLSPSNNSLHVDTGKCPSLPQMRAGHIIAQLPTILGNILPLNQALCGPFPQGTLLPQTPCSHI